MFSKKQIFLAGVLLINEAKQLHTKPHELSTQNKKWSYIVPFFADSSSPKVWCAANAQLAI